MRFRSEQHVRRQRDFRNLRENGRRLDCGGFAFWYCKRPDERPDKPALRKKQGAPETTGRLGVVASSAATGNAVARARAKRRLREAFRRNQRLVPPGYDIMLVAKRQLDKQDFSVIEQAFTSACLRAFQTNRK